MNFRTSLIAAAFSAVSFSSFAAVEVSKPYARATPPHAPNSAAFMMLKNSGDESVSLVKAATPVAKKVELHTHTMDGGMMKMRQVENIEIPANGMSELKPGGLHIMLFGLQNPLKEGETLTLTLSFSDGTKVTKNIPVKKVMTGSQMKHKH
ncbi:copper chaperone PCu(A)C [Grimontia sp. NTOU-MAR1]|uniref:copper chaperone PCu(A)C n=1 Tax=Grimontia sp. NTOU-MAR1 TaxID=3111011 RepID=UPI002DBAEEB5|nr:copper chaperone PCu(A)C [Grimontia sp. NTOU-MAR1]WRW00097.1 copper chaperone PCu(A)C [Grimontia sp. NTOU-MAR1]